MILVDTSVWVDHFRSGNRDLAALLRREQVMTLPFIIGELSCGAIRQRESILEHVTRLPRAAVADDDEVMALVEGKRCSVVASAGSMRTCSHPPCSRAPD